MDADLAKQRCIDHVELVADELLAVSHRIHTTPELAFEERHAHDLLCDALDAAGFAVQRHAAGLDTAFVARAGRSGPTVAVFCEYDALPEIGHACGHNIIAAIGLGAGLATAGVADAVGGRVVVVGSPAEEGGGGKALLAGQGALEGIDAAVMVHPGGRDLTRFHVVAIRQVRVRYRGQAAHAAAAPHEGRNALDAAVLAYVNVAALRQHLRGDERVHGTFTDGGGAPNVVPATAAQHWFIRAGDRRRLASLADRVETCLTSGAAAAGCEVELEWVHPAYDELLDSAPIVECYVDNAARVGRTVESPTTQTAVLASTDMGNVSQIVPSIHPMIAVSPPTTPIHTTDFERCAAGPAGDRAVLDGAKALAMTIVDLWTRPEVLARARAELDAARTRVEES